MTPLALLLLITAALLALSAVRLARVKLMQDATITAQAATIEGQKETIDLYSASLQAQRVHIDLLTEQVGQLEDLNAFYLRVIRANAYTMIMALPTLERPTVLDRREEINLN